MSSISFLRFCSITVLGFLLLHGAAAAFEIVMPTTKPSRLFMSDEEITRLRQRAQDPQWEKHCADLLRDAEKCMENIREIPHQGGQWTHWHNGHEDGGKLTAEPPTAHRCAHCDEVYSGYPYDDAYITLVHNRIINELKTIATAYALDPRSAWAEHIRATLLEYASFYESLPYHDFKNGDALSGGRLYAQTLDESVSLCHLCFAYDLVYGDPCFSEEDHEQIKDKLLLPMCETIQRYDMRISNWQTWHNAGVVCAGLLAGDRELVDWAINGKSGFMFQLDRSILSGGMWYEGAPSYHWYSFHALFYMLEATDRVGMKLWDQPQMKAMLDGPLRQIYPDLTFPAIHDSIRSSILADRGFYEMGYSRFKEEAYLPLLDKRDNRYALLYGVDSLPEGDHVLTLKSSNDEEEALAILRSGDGKTAVFLDYTRARIGHMHPATVNLLIYAHGNERTVDAGRLPYGNPLHNGWCRQTISHNTVVVNESSHRRIESECVFFESNDLWSAARVKVKLEGGKHRLDRSIVLLKDLVIDVFRASSREEAVFDQPLHLRGEWSQVPPLKEEVITFDAAGYKELRDMREVKEPQRWYTLITGDTSRIEVQVLDQARQYVGRSPGYEYNENLPFLMRRLEGEEALFVTAYHLLEGETLPDTLRCDIGPAGEVTITCRDQTISLSEESLSIVP